MKIHKRIQNITFYILILFISLNITLIQSANEKCACCKINNNKCVLKEECTETPNFCDQNCRPHLYNNDNEGQCYDCTSALTSNSYYYINNDGICQAKTDCDLVTIENNECVDDDCGTGYILEMTVEGTTYARCTSSCPSGYFDLKTKKCVKECKGSTDRITKENGCTDICEESTFLFTQIEKINGNHCSCQNNTIITISIIAIQLVFSETRHYVV